MADEVELRDRPERARYEVLVDGRVAGFAMYRREPGRTVFTHTIVKPAYEGRGLGGRLARYVLDDVVARGERIVPECPFIRAYLERHPAYEASVDPIAPVA